jgi:hypothetical protein
MQPTVHYQLETDQYLYIVLRFSVNGTHFHAHPPHPPPTRFHFVLFRVRDKVVCPVYLRFCFSAQTIGQTA